MIKYNHKAIVKIYHMCNQIKFSYKLCCSLKLQLYSIYFLLDVNFNKLIIKLHFLLVFFMLAKLPEDQRAQLVKYLIIE